MLLSVIIVTRNPNYDLYVTLSSLLILNRPDVEIIVKDHSDKEDISDINKKFGFTNLTFVHKRDAGIFDAMNQAIALAKGEFLFFINAGDQYYNCNLLGVLAKLDDRIGYVYGDIINLYPFVRLVRYPNRINRYYNFLKTICHQAVVFRRNVFIELGCYETSLRQNSDALVIMEMVMNYKGYYLNNFISIYKGQGFSTTYIMTKHEQKIYHDKLSLLYSKSELLFLRLTSSIIRVILFLKNFRKASNDRL